MSQHPHGSRAPAPTVRAEQLQQRLDLVLANITDYAIFAIDTERRVVWWNSGAEQILGYRPDEIVGQSADVVFTPEDRAAGAPEHEMATAIRDGRADDERWHLRKDGTRFFGSGILTAIRDEQDRLLGFAKIMRDFTERQRAEAERERLLRQATDANRIKDEFLGTISHELRTPLNSILGWTRMLRDNALDDDRRRSALEIVERNARSQAQLIDDLLDVSRIITGKLRLHVEPVGLIHAITSALDAVRPAADAKQIHLAADLDPDADLIMADPERIEQIIWNLLTNAIKFTAPGGRITTATLRRHHEVELAISDTGIGIAPEFLPYVFDRFRQAESGTTRTQSGLGLGLAIVRHLVELHGGTVAAESAGHGTGAIFRVRLPAATALSSPAIRPQASSVESGTGQTSTRRSLCGIRVVALDDDGDTRELIMTTLRRLDADVVGASSVTEALAAVEAHRPHVVLADIALPGEDGYAFLRRLRQLTAEATGAGLRRRIPAVAVTAYARDTDRTQAIDAGFDAHLSKPLDLDELARLVDTLANLPPSD